MSGGGPKYSSHRAKELFAIAKRKSKQGDLEEFNKQLKGNKYPKCIGKTFFEDCPKEVEDIKNPPKECRICSQYETPAAVIRERFLKLQEEMKES